MVDRSQTANRIDLHFPLQGTTIPRDHGYALFGALCRILGDLHDAQWLAVHPIRGRPIDQTTLRFPDNQGTLSLRLPPVEIPKVLGLADKTIELNGHALCLGLPTVQPLIARSSVEARMVVIKGFMEEGLFREAVDRQLVALGVGARAEITRRRVLAINGDHVVGFGVRLHELSENGSLTVQSHGLGGRQRMGCGVFGAALAQGVARAEGL